MKDKQLKKALKTDFLKEAPADFTQKVMTQVQANPSTYKPLLPKTVLWSAAIGCFIFILFVLYNVASVGITLSLPNFSQLITDLLPVLLVPFCILCLLFIQSFAKYRRVAK